MSTRQMAATTGGLSKQDSNTKMQDLTSAVGSGKRSEGVAKNGQEYSL